LCGQTKGSANRIPSSCTQLALSHAASVDSSVSTLTQHHAHFGRMKANSMITASGWTPIARSLRAFVNDTVSTGWQIVRRGQQTENATAIRNSPCMHARCRVMFARTRIRSRIRKIHPCVVYGTRAVSASRTPP